MNLTSQFQLSIDMLAMNEHNNDAIEGIIVLPRLDAITKPLGSFTCYPRSIVRDLLPFAKMSRSLTTYICYEFATTHMLNSQWTLSTWTLGLHLFGSLATPNDPSKMS